MTRYQNANSRGLLLVGDNRVMPMIPDRSIAVILTSPPYWVRGKGRESAVRYARKIARDYAREWLRVLSPRGELWIIMGDRHDGREWIGMDGLVADCLRQTGWSLQAKGFWMEDPSMLRWDDRINYILRFTRAGIRSLPTTDMLCLNFPIPWSPPGSLWDAMPPEVIQKILSLSPAGTVLDPFFGTGAVGAVADQIGRSWIGVEWNRSQARVAVRRLHLTRSVGGE